MIEPAAVFLGPSLDLAEARRILPARYCPPARKGDIYRLLASGVRTIVLIDGVFHSTPSVWPRELLEAIDAGMTVIGASSMGALRAAELHTLGMIGCGTVFSWYRDGLITGDDEVALLHGTEDAGYRALSEPLVNIRATLARAVADACLSASQADSLLDEARRTSYPQRSYRALLQGETARGLSDDARQTLERVLHASTVNIKREDAIGALRLAAAHRADAGRGVAEPVHASADQEQPERVWLTAAWSDNGSTSDLHAVIAAIRRDEVLLARVTREAVARAFLLDLARDRRVAVPAHVASAAHDRLASMLPCPDRWLRRSALTRRTAVRLLTERLFVDWLVQQPPAAIGIDVDPQAAAGDARFSAGAGESPDVGLRWRPLLQAWADDRGVHFPDEWLEPQIRAWERVGGPRAAFLERHGVDEAAFRDGFRRYARIGWMLDKGPAFFGAHWSLDVALARELQVTAVVAAAVEATT